MNILFLSISTAVSNLQNRGIYPDLLRKFAEEGHNLFIACPCERRIKKPTNIIKRNNITTICSKTFNLTKTNILEKGISTILIEYQFSRAINKYFPDIRFDLILYSTPPITFNSLVSRLKLKHNAKTYLLLKDIFPQNAIDLEMFSKINPLYWYFRAKERKLYYTSDYIGCMSPANVEYILKHNSFLPRNRVEVCPNSIEIIESPEVPKSEIREFYNIPLESIVFLFGGNIGKPQGIDFLINILKYNKNRSDIYFIIVGDGTEIRKLTNCVDNYCRDNTLVLKHIPKLEYDKLIKVADVGLIFLDKRFTIPNFPSRLLSYLENKMPVLMATDLITDIGPLAEENGFGYWVENGDIIKFNNYLDEFVNNKHIIKLMGVKGFNFLKKNYNVERSYEIIMSHFS